MFYSLRGAYPSSLPFRIRLSNGQTRTDPITFTAEEIADAGYVSVEYPPTPASNQVLEWDSVNLAWKLRSKTEQELQTERAQTQAQINQIRDQRVAQGFLFQGNMFDSREEDQKRIAGATQLAFMAIMSGAQPGDYTWAGEGTFQWIAQDNTLVNMDAQTVVEFGRIAAAWERAHVFAARSLKDMEVIPENYSDDIWWPSAV